MENIIISSGLNNSLEQTKYINRLRDKLNNNPELYYEFIEAAKEVEVLKDNNELCRQNLEVIKGFMMEAFIVSKANKDINVLKALFKIASNRKKLPNDEYVKKFEPIGTGFLSTKINFPKFYIPQDPKDIIFIKSNKKTKQVEPATVVNGKNIASVQIKTIKSGLKKDIINPLIVEKYMNVITCLEFEEGYHSKDACFDIIKALKDDRILQCYRKKYKITKDVRNRIKNSIFSPDDIGIPQQEVNEYLEFIEAWFYGTKNIDKDDLYNNIELALKLIDERVKKRMVRFGIEVQIQT